MAKEKGKVLRNIYGIFLALLTVLVGALFIIQTWAIYRASPQSPYTVESISKGFKEIALPVWLWVVAVLGNIALAIAFPLREKPAKAKADVRLAVARMKKRLPTEGELSYQSERLTRRQEGFRIVVGTVCALFALAAFGVCLLVLWDILYTPFIQRDFFTAHNAVVDRIVQCAVISAAALLLCSIGAYLFAWSRKREQKGYARILAEAKKPIKQAEKPVEKETEPTKEEASRWSGVIESVVGALFLGQSTTGKALDKAVERAMEGEEAEPAPKPQKEKPVKAVKREPKAKRKSSAVGVNVLRVALVAVGVFLIVVGVQNGGMKDVLLKAINICTQCIGLG